MAEKIQTLLTEIRACTVCQGLPLGPRPVLQVGKAKILIAGQAPGIRVHKSGIPFDDPSGQRLRTWMGIDKETFYNPDMVNIIPMGFCYPGTLEKGGDLPPRPECAATWHQQLFKILPRQTVKLVIGQYAHAYHLGGTKEKTLTATVEKWRDFAPDIFPMPHPSPRNIFWLKRNPWFELEVIPALQARIKEVLET
ncbi:MAG: uracil-DNA glycosylase family protein [Sphingomonadales bacterium]